MTERSCDVLVVGAGIAGASAAADIAGDAKVILLERESQPGYHSTGRSAALYIRNYGSKSVRALTAASFGFFTAPPENFAEQPLLSRRGALELAHEGQEEAFATALEEADGLKEIAVSEALELVPKLRPEGLLAAAYEPDAQDIDVAALHQGMLRRLRARGGELITGAAVMSLAWEGSHWRIETSAGRFQADTLVNAAGAWADQLAVSAGLAPLGLQPRRRTALIIEGPSDCDTAAWPLTGDVGESYYFKPEAGGRLMLSPADATAVEPSDVQPEELDVAIAIDRFESHVDHPVRRIEHRWAGLRTFAPDDALVIGHDPRTEGFFWLAGQGGYGVQTSPAAAATARDLLIDGRLRSELLKAGVRTEALAPARLL
jgi:D-arginine dehydrogenase